MKNNIVVLIQARMNSIRLPRKTMINLGNRPVIEHLLLSIDQISDMVDEAVLTSKLEDNDLIRNYCYTKKIKVFSGDEENVASRFYEFLNEHAYKYFVRISADSPLFDYRILKNTLENISNHDIYSTIYLKRFPSGMNFEIIRSELFLNEYHNFYKNEHFEHVTPYYYENSSKFRIKQVDIPLLPTDNDYSFCIDTLKDKINLEKIIGAMDKEHYEYDLFQKCLIYDEVISDRQC